MGESREQELEAAGDIMSIVRRGEQRIDVVTQAPHSTYAVQDPCPGNGPANYDEPSHIGYSNQDNPLRHDQRPPPSNSRFCQVDSYKLIITL